METKILTFGQAQCFHKACESYVKELRETYKKLHVHSGNVEFSKDYRHTIKKIKNA